MLVAHPGSLVHEVGPSNIPAGEHRVSMSFDIQGGSWEHTAYSDVHLYSSPVSTRENVSSCSSEPSATDPLHKAKVTLVVKNMYPNQVIDIYRRRANEDAETKLLTLQPNADITLQTSFDESWYLYDTWNTPPKLIQTCVPSHELDQECIAVPSE